IATAPRRWPRSSAIRRSPTTRSPDWRVGAGRRSGRRRSCSGPTSSGSPSRPRLPYRRRRGPFCSSRNGSPRLAPRRLVLVVALGERDTPPRHHANVLHAIANLLARALEHVGAHVVALVEPLL